MDSLHDRDSCLDGLAGLGAKCPMYVWTASYVMAPTRVLAAVRPPQRLCLALDPTTVLRNNPPQDLLAGLHRRLARPRLLVIPWRMYDFTRSYCFWVTISPMT